MYNPVAEFAADVAEVIVRQAAPKIEAEIAADNMGYDHMERWADYPPAPPYEPGSVYAPERPWHPSYGTVPPSARRNPPVPQVYDQGMDVGPTRSVWSWVRDFFDGVNKQRRFRD